MIRIFERINNFNWKTRKPKDHDSGGGGVNSPCIELVRLTE